MIKPYYDQDGIQIYHGDCREILPELPKVDLVLTDPPYFNVLDEEWDRQWGKADEFIAWIREVISACVRLMNDNGTIYVFSSSKMAGRVESVVSEHANVIASCVWDKGGERMGAAGSGIDVTALRTYWSSGSERCVVGEKRPFRYEQSDAAARDACGYWDACQDVKRSVFGDYFKGEFERAGVTQRQIAELFPSRTGGTTGCVSNWLLGHNCPTKEQYEAIRRRLGVGYLRKNYEDLRKNYEDLRKNYEDLRRPFNLTASHQWGDIWRWPVEKRGRKHPAQKPLGLIKQIVDVSSRKGGIVLDAFMGSGTTLRAAKDLGRRAIGIEIEEKYCEIAVNRLRQKVLQFE